MWTQVGEIAFKGWTDDVLDRLRVLHRAAARQRHLPGLLDPRRSPSAALVDLRTAYGRIYRAIAEVTGSRVVVDASKGPALGQALAGAPGIDLRLLNVVRDPRAVAWSWGRQVERPHAGGGAEMWRIPARRSAAQWSALQVELAAIRRVGGRPSARLRYEDFVDDPVGSLVQVTELLGVPLSPADLPRVEAGRVSLSASHGLSGNPARFVSGDVELRRDDAWARSMPAGDQVVATALTLPLLLAYGYRVAPGPTTSSRQAPRLEARSTP